MTTKRFLAFDLGAESGRAVLGAFDGERLTLSEFGRFPTTGSNSGPGLDGVRRWEFERIWSEIHSLLTKAEADAPLDGVGVDTWGVDFSLLDGDLLEPPVCYRDESHSAAMNSLVDSLGKEAIWNATGIQILPFNTLFQLMAAQKRDPNLLERAKTLLFMPDLIASRLAGGSYMGAERTIASTSQMLDPETRKWNLNLLKRAGLPAHFLPALTQAGTLIGVTPNGTPVYATAGHDTAAAVAAAPSSAESTWAYLSSGTWSLFGVERTEPLLTQSALALGFSNEGGVDGNTRLLKNIMGLWLVQECRRALGKRGAMPTYEELTSLANTAPAGGPIFDAADHRFLNPPDMPKEIRAACAESGQTPPDSTGALIRCCLESLAEAYSRSLTELNSLLGIDIQTLHIVGGGTRNVLLNQWTADACGIRVVAGPDEATAAGNIFGQMIGAGLLRDWNEARTLSRASFSPVEYLPGKSF